MGLGIRIRRGFPKTLSGIGHARLPELPGSSLRMTPETRREARAVRCPEFSGRVARLGVPTPYARGDPYAIAGANAPFDLNTFACIGRRGFLRELLGISI